MTTEEEKKAFYINHQKVSLDIDFASKAILATTELQIYFNSAQLPYIRLHSKIVDINQIFINNVECRFEIFDPSVETCQIYSKSNYRDPEVFQKLFNSTKDISNLGELAIEIPSSIDLQNHLSPDIVNKDEENSNAPPTARTAPAFLRIDYIIRNPQSGVVFSSNSRVNENDVSSYLYTLNQLGAGDARYWVPTLDEQGQRFTWELDFVVTKRNLKTNSDISVVASGVQVTQNKQLQDDTVLNQYFVAFPCPAYLVSFSIGRFDSLLITELDCDENEQEVNNNAYGNNGKQVIAYSPIGWKEELRHTTQTVEKTLDYYMTEFGPYPLDSLKIVFLQTSNIPMIVGAEVIIISLEFLHSDEIIDQTFETRRIIALALASQYFGANIVPKDPTDIWIILGFSGFMTSLFLKSHFGYNEYRYRMKQDMIKISQLDVNRPPLYNEKLAYPYDLEDISFIRLKGTFVLYMLDKQMLKGAAAYGLHRLIPKILMSAMVGELGPGNLVSTYWFLKTCRKVSGVTIRSFADQWIYSSGCPIFSFKYQFNRKKMVVEIEFEQTTTNAALSLNEEQEGLIKPAKFFTGNLTACIQEPDGTPYEHILEIHENSSHFEVQFNTKYKRIRRTTKRFQKRKAEAAAAEAIVKDQLDGDNPEDDVLFLTEDGNEGEKEAWRIIEWGEADKESNESATFEWIRLDSDFEWICIVNLEQPDYMWAGQLEKDRDVVSQYEAVVALRRFPSLATSTTLLRTIMNNQCFYRIRADAALSLVYCSLERLEYIGRDHLLRIYHKRFCIDTLKDEKNPELFLPKPNDFASFTEYFVQKALITGLSLLDEPKSQSFSKKLILNLLKNNDNSSNPYSDSYYVSTLIASIGNVLINQPPSNEEEFDQSADNTLNNALIYELTRFSSMDHLIPSYHNIVTVSCLQVHTKLIVARILPSDVKIFLRHSRYGNFLHVRMAAFDGLLVSGGLMIEAVREYIFNSIEHDPEPFIRYYVVSNMAKAIALYQRKLERTIIKDDDDPLNFSSYYEVTPLQYSNDKWVEFKKDKFCKECIWRMLLNSFIDPKIRNTLFIICKLIYPSSDPINIDYSMFKAKIYNPLLLKYRDEDVSKEVETSITREDSIGLKIRLNRNKPIKEEPKVHTKHEFTDHSDAMARSPSPIDVLGSYDLKPAIKSPIHESPFTLKSKQESPSEQEPDYLSIVSPTFDIENDDKFNISIEERRPKVSIEERKPKIPIQGRKTHISVQERKPKTPIQERKPNIEETSNKHLNRNVIKPSRIPNKEEVPFKNPAIPHKLEATLGKYRGESSILKQNGGYKPYEVESKQNIPESSLIKKSNFIARDEHDKVDVVGNIETNTNHIQRQQFNESGESKVHTRLSSKVKDPDTHLKVPKHRSSLNEPSNYTNKPSISKTDNKICKSVINTLFQQSSVNVLKNFTAELIKDDSNPSAVTKISLRKIRDKVENCRYPTIDAFRKDVNFLFKSALSSGRFENEEMQEVEELKRLYVKEYKRLTNPSPLPPSTPQIKVDLEQKSGRASHKDPVANPFYRSKSYESVKVILRAIMGMSQAEPYLYCSVTPFKEAINPGKALFSMDLNKIRVELKTGSYQSSSAIFKDLMSLFSNGLKMVAPSSITYKRTKEVISFLKEEWKREFPDDMIEVSNEENKHQPPTIAAIKIEKERETLPVIKDRHKEKEFNIKMLYQFGIRLVTKLELHPSSPQFRLPVDPVALGIPTYLDEIKEPMDLRHIRTTLEAKNYKSFSKLDYDIKLLYRNAQHFNQPNTWVYDEATRFEKYYNSLIANFNGTFEMGQHDILENILDRVKTHSCSEIFSSSVEFKDKMKEELDLKIISSKIKKKYYTHFGEFENDFIEMLHVAFSYYDESDPKFQHALKFEKYLVKHFTRHFPDIPLRIGNVSKKKRLIFMDPSISTLCEKLVKKLMSNPAADAFLKPVDCKAIPLYPLMIRQPMDLSTIKKKISAKEYKLIKDFESDVKLIFTNCYNFNGPESYYSEEAKKLETVFNKEWVVIVNNAKRSKQDLSSSHPSTNQRPSVTILNEATTGLSRQHIDSLNSALEDLKKHKHFYIFSRPVDPKADGAPTYFDVIKNPMDFGTIRQNIKKNKYTSLKPVLYDAELVFKNCFAFNHPRDPVYGIGEDVQKTWHRILQKYKLGAIDKEEGNSPRKREALDVGSPKHKVRRSR
ncbi:hypothetical protein K502DRAFT_346691 [Neoconidiobolus thromboides FSU 785]|nr:hypothetical protein K502DRAFT_346691 [Neoconidiobolus thromboides FSU 785]